MQVMTMPQRAVIAMVVAVMVAGCAGQKATYSSSSAAPVDVDLVQITPAYLRQQQALSKAFQGQQELIQANLDKLDAQSRESAADYRYVIGKADVLLISVPTIVSFNAGNAPGVLGEQGQGYTVFDDGTIYLPFTGPVRVGGLTLREAQARIVEALSKVYHMDALVNELKTGQVMK